MKLCLIALSFAVSAFAQTVNFDAKPGLWETTTVSKSAGMPAIDTSKMSPEVRQRVEESMKKNMAPQTHTTRSCMTKEKLEKDLFLDPKQTSASCKRTIVTNTRTTVDVKIECANDKYATAGTFHLEALSRESVKGTFKTTIGPMQVNVDMTSKWIGSDCGDVK